MPVIRHGTPDTINLYLTHPLPPSTLSILESDFAVGAQEKYSPLAKLAVSESYGCSAEDIRRRLEVEAQAEGKDPTNLPPFLVADDQTGEEGNVILVDTKWAERQDFIQGFLVESPDWPESGPLPFLLKVRIFMHDATNSWQNISIGNCDIFELIPIGPSQHFYPSAPLPPPEETGDDWRNKPPYPASVCASPRSFEVSDDPANTARYLPRPEKVYRLTKEASEQLGLIPKWAVAWSSKDGPEGSEGSMNFVQPWKPR